MSQQPPSPPSPSSPQLRDLWSDAATPYKVGIVFAALGWLVSLSTLERRTENGVVVSCSYVDLARLGVAGLLVVLAVTGFLVNRTKPYRRLPTALAAGVSVVLVAAAVFYGLSGAGLVLSPCQAG